MSEVSQKKTKNDLSHTQDVKIHRKEVTKVQRKHNVRIAPQLRWQKGEPEREG